MTSSHRQQPHFLIVALHKQSHINPALSLARHLIATGATVTFSTSAHRRMLPSDTADLTFIPYPDAYVTRTFQPDATHAPCSKFSAILLDLAARGRRVTRVIHTLLTWAADAAHDLKIPSAQFWIQPATAFTAYYHFFHGYEPLMRYEAIP